MLFLGLEGQTLRLAFKVASNQPGECSHAPHAPDLYLIHHADNSPSTQRWSTLYRGLSVPNIYAARCIVYEIPAVILRSRSEGKSGRQVESSRLRVASFNSADEVASVLTIDLNLLVCDEVSQRRNVID